MNKIKFSIISICICVYIQRDFTINFTKCWRSVYKFALFVTKKKARDAATAHGAPK